MPGQGMKREGSERAIEEIEKAKDMQGKEGSKSSLEGDGYNLSDRNG